MLDKTFRRSARLEIVILFRFHSQLKIREVTIKNCQLVEVSR